jgi:hypothetical protein
MIITVSLTKYTVIPLGTKMTKDYLVYKFALCDCSNSVDEVNNRIECDLGDKNVKASMFVVPTELIYVILCTKCFTIALNVVKEIVTLRRSP